MAHAGTMDLGGNALTKQGGSRWAAIALTLAVVVATIAGIWLASSAGLVGGTAAKPVADRSLDQIEAQRGIVVVGTTAGLMTGKAADDIALGRNNAYDQIEVQRGTVTMSSAQDEYLNGILDRAHATPFVVTSQAQLQYLNSILDRAHATPYVVTNQAQLQYLNSILDRAHATPYVAPVKRDRVGGP